MSSRANPFRLPAASPKEAGLVDHILDDLVKGARGNHRTGEIDVDRPGGESKMAHQSYLGRAKNAGAQTALEKFALSPGMAHALELGGLGLIAAPVAHSAIAGEKNENPQLTRTKHISDLAGLGLLATPTLMKVLKR